MRKIFTVLILIASVLSAQSWVKVNEASYSYFSGIYFLNETTGWAVGSKGMVIKTTDGGDNWFFPASEMPVEKSLYAVYFVDENIGYVGGSSETILKTTNGGESWSELKFSGISGTIHSIYFADENTGWLLSSKSSKAVIAKTTDGGATWTTVLSHNGGDIEDMAFYSNGKGICSGGGGGVYAIYYTTDGDNWSKGSVSNGFPPVYTRTDLRAVYMTSETVGHIVGWGSAAAGLQPSIHLKTTDGGATWTYVEQQTENRTYVNLWDVTFKDANNGLAVGGGSYEGSVVIKTTDGGENWVPIEVPFGFTVKNITNIGDKVWISGSSGGLAYSPDFGNTWKLLVPMPSATLYTLDIVGNNFYAAGFNGLFVKSNDGGATWKASYVSVDKHCPTIKDLFFLDSQKGFAVGNNRRAVKTTDGGQTWTKMLEDTSWTRSVNYGVSFVNENVGYVVGKYETGTSAFYKTTDGGNSWTKKIGTFPDHLTTVYFFDENHGVVGGRNMLIQYTENGGNSWTAATINNVPSAYSGSDINSIKFLNNQFGLACGKMLIKTTDGGKNWDYVSIPILEKEIKSVVIVDEQKWYVLGSIFIFKTEDGGQNWTDVTNADDISTTSLYAAGLGPKGKLWFTGGNSSIYSSAEPVSVEKENGTIVHSYFLEQNYPNPFGTAVKGSNVTNIRFGLKKAGYVTLKIYDALGKSSVVLLNKFLNLGVYNILFDASKFSSGVYFYSLRVNNYFVTKKMLLIK